MTVVGSWVIVHHSCYANLLQQYPYALEKGAVRKEGGAQIKSKLDALSVKQSSTAESALKGTRSGETVTGRIHSQKLVFVEWMARVDKISD